MCALIGAEDPLFFQHRGFWWHQIRIAVLRAFVERRGIRGVSTITQQLARNLYLAPTRSVARKLREGVLAWRLERVLTKRRILELYLNVVEWGDGIWGITVAAQEYCGRQPRDLDAFESAVLVSLLPAPTAPLIGTNARRAFAAQRRVPRFLYSAGLLSREAEEDALIRLTQLHRFVEAALPLPVAIQRVTATVSSCETTRSTETVDEILANCCGWCKRLSYEEFLVRARRNPAMLRSRPMWWTGGHDFEEPVDATP
jgi:monofunctional biosynthetic peptidoglycan transglycosylase